MRGIHPLTLALALVLATAPIAQAAFSNTYPDEDGALLGVDASDTSTTSLQSTRSFRIDNTAAVPVYVKMLGNEGEAVYLTEAGYTADVYLSTDNGTTWTQVAQDVNHTDPSASVDMASTDEPMLRVVLNFPTERSVRVVPVAFHVALQDAGDGGQNGGVSDSSFTHSVRLNFYDDSTDADGDAMGDAWEYEHFGALDNPNGAPGADPDGDGATNADEEAAGTDPNDDQDTPEPPPDNDDPPTNGGVDGNTKGAGWVIVLGYLGLLAALVASVLISRRFDRPLYAFGGWFAVLWTVASVVLWLMERFAPGKGWTPWAYPAWAIGPLFWTVTVAVAVLGGASLMMLRQGQDSQRVTGGAALGGVIVVLGGALLYLGLLDVPTLLTG